MSSIKNQYVGTFKFKPVTQYKSPVTGKYFTKDELVELNAEIKHEQEKKYKKSKLSPLQYKTWLEVNDYDYDSSSE
jgi:hypothetical protein